MWLYHESSMNREWIQLSNRRPGFGEDGRVPVHGSCAWYVFSCSVRHNAMFCMCLWLRWCRSSVVDYSVFLGVLCRETGHVRTNRSWEFSADGRSLLSRLLCTAYSLHLLTVVWTRRYQNKVKYIFSSCRVLFCHWWYGLMLVLKADDLNFRAVKLSKSLSFSHCSVIWKPKKSSIIFNASFSCFNSFRISISISRAPRKNTFSLKVTQFPYVNRVTFGRNMTTSLRILLSWFEKLRGRHEVFQCIIFMFH